MLKRNKILLSTLGVFGAIAPIAIISSSCSERRIKKYLNSVELKEFEKKISSSETIKYQRWRYY